MIIIDCIYIMLAIVLGFSVFFKFRREIKYEIRDNSLEIKRRKLKHLYRTINA